MTLTKLLTSTANSPLAGLHMTPSERKLGRFMRAPDGHDAGGGEGGEAGKEGGGAGDGAAEGKDDATVLGGAADSEGGEKKGDEAGKGEGEGGAAQGAAVAPDKYELTPPDGFETIDSEVLEAATPTLKELGLTNEQAQKLVPIMGSAIKKAIDRAESVITDRAIQNRKEWAEAFDKDPEIGGANKAQTVADAAKAFDHYGLKKGEGLRLLLDESGLGNYPDLIRFVAKVGRDLAEGTHDRGSAASTPKTAEQALYGPEFQAKG